MIEKTIKDAPHFEKTDYTWKTLKSKVDTKDYFVENGIKYINL